MTGWAADPPPRPPTTAAGLVRAGLRGAAMGAVTLVGLVALLLVRLVERPLCGLGRPVSPRITRLVCRAALRILGLGLQVRGTPMRHHGALVSNHCSWLDIIVLNACDLVYFVAKAEVAGWLWIGWLARSTGTVFIRRDPRDAAEQKQLFEARLGAGHRLLFFPEGTSTDSRRVLPFKSTLFAAFFAPHLHAACWVQPVSLLYAAPAGEDPRFYGWWGTEPFLANLRKVLAAPRQGSVEVVFHPPLRVAGFPDRKAIAAAAEAAVRSPLAG